MSSKTRRRLLQTVAGTAGIISIGSGSAAADPGQAEVIRRRYTLLEGTEQATPLYLISSGEPGPTGLIIGGMHGDEEAGYLTAERLAHRLDIDRGRLLIIPKADKVAVERGTRSGPNGNLNRQFPIGETPTTDLAQAIWFVVRLSDPDIFLNLHESRGIYQREPEGVGQAIFYSPGEAGLANSAAEYVNENCVEEPRYSFRTGCIVGEQGEPSGLFTSKVAYDLNKDGFLIETYEGLPLEKRMTFMSVIVNQFLDRRNFL